MFGLQVLVMGFFLLVFSPQVVEATSSSTVLFSEIAWMGTAANTADEWVELYNGGDSDVDLTNWGIFEGGGATLVEALEGKIKKGEYFLIERTDDTTIADVSASQPPSSWGGSGLSNSGEHLVLKNEKGEVVDEVDASGGWFAGDSGNKATMERQDYKSQGSSAWQTSTGSLGKDAHGGVIHGTPRVENSPSSESSPTPDNPTDSSQETSESQYNSTVRINEVLPNPVGSDEQEFVELYNYGGEQVDLSGWEIGDEQGKKKLGSVLGSSFLPPNGYAVLYKSAGSVSLNNDGDNLSLFGPDGKVIDQVAYANLAEGVSFAYENGSWRETTSPTPGEKNRITQVPAKESATGDEPEIEIESGEETRKTSSLNGPLPRITPATPTPNVLSSSTKSTNPNAAAKTSKKGFLNSIPLLSRSSRVLGDSATSPSGKVALGEEGDGGDKGGMGNKGGSKLIWVLRFGLLGGIAGMAWYLKHRGVF